MGRYNNGVNGPFRGRIGKVVGSRSHGTDHMRSLPELTKNEPTEKQLKQRHIFAMVSGWLRRIKLIINVGFQLFANGKTPMNIAHRLISKEALVIEDGKTIIDYKSVILSQGQLLISFVTEIIGLVDAILSFKWKNSKSTVLNAPDDKATFVIYNPIKDVFATFIGDANREDEQVNLQLPKSFTGDAVHCWMHYVNVDGSSVSSSNYLGEILVG